MIFYDFPFVKVELNGRVDKLMKDFIKVWTNSISATRREISPSRKERRKGKIQPNINE